MAESKSPLFGIAPYFNSIFASFVAHYLPDEAAASDGKQPQFAVGRFTLQELNHRDGVGAGQPFLLSHVLPSKTHSIGYGVTEKGLDKDGEVFDVAGKSIRHTHCVRLF